MANLLRPLFLAALLTLGMAAASFGLSGPGDDDSDGQTDRRQLRQDAAPPEGAQPLPAVLARNWDAWAAGRPVLDAKALVPLFANAAIRGENAAALAALDFALRRPDASGAPTAALTRAEALALRDPAVLAFYADRVRLLRKLPRALFAHGAPDIRSLELGPGGDSALFATLGWLARSRPRALKTALRQLPDGRLRVEPPGCEPVGFPTPTDAELARRDRAATLAGGLWGPALEKAWDALLARQARELPADGAPRAPQISDVVRLWTGSPVLGLRLNGSGQAATDASTLRSSLATMAAQNALALARVASQRNAPANAPTDASLPAGLVCAILNYDAMTDTLTLWDPRGDDFSPAGPEGPEFGHARKHGVFHLSLAEFERLFAAIAVEQNNRTH